MGVNKEKNLSWFPGHMKQAADEIKKRLPIVDLIIEIGDARAPYSSLNSYLDKIIEGKKKVIIYSKKDLADPSRLAPILSKYANESQPVMVLDFKNRSDISSLLSFLSSIKTAKMEKYLRFNMAVPPTRALVIGIPNVGKSTLINSLVGKKKTSVANKPGHTRAQQLVKVGNKLELFDTPGILQPNYEDKMALMHLAWLGSLNDEAIPLQDVYMSLCDFVLEHYPSSIYKRYKIDPSVVLNRDCFFEEIAKARCLLLSGGEYDVERAKSVFLKEFRAGDIVRCEVDDV